jgi:hypothetical protein
MSIIPKPRQGCAVEGSAFFSARVKSRSLAALGMTERLARLEVFFRSL